MRARSYGQQSGFTLIEMLVVIVIIGILMGMLGTALYKSKYAAKKAQAAAEIKTLASALRNYRHEYGRWPLPRATVSGLHEFDTNHRTIIDYMTDTSDPDKNPRNIQFANWNEYFTMGVDDEGQSQRKPLGQFMLEKPGADVAIVDPWREPLIFIFDLDQDLGRVENQTLDIRYDA